MPFQHTLQGEHKFENLYLIKDHVGAVLERIRDGYDLTGDVLLASYPKAGSTWMQELLWLLMNDANFEVAKTTPLLSRSPVFEYSLQGVDQLDRIAEWQRPRFLRTHLPARFLQKQLTTSLKVVLLVRNPKDQLVSFYHFYRMAGNMNYFPGSWDDFFELYKEKHLFYGDMFDWYREWMPLVRQENIKLVKYEDMVKNLRGVTEELTAFLGKTLRKAQLDEMVEHLSFKSMRDNDMVNYKDSMVFRQDISPFIRKGIVGDWKNYFSKEQSDLVDAAYRDTMEAAGVNLEFE